MPSDADRCDVIAAWLDQHQAQLAILVLAGMLALFVSERLTPAVVALCGVAAYLVLGVLDMEGALAVMSNAAPLTVGAMLVLSSALVRTGTLDAVAWRFVGLSARAPWVGVAGLLGLTAVSSAFVNNTPVVLLMVPLVERLSRSTAIPASRLLIPVSYMAVLGGTCTLIGTSTSLVVDGVVREYGMRPFGIFEMTPVALVGAAAGVGVLAVLGPLVLPRRDSDLLASASAEYLTEVVVADASPIVGKQVRCVRRLHHDGIRVLAVLRGGTRYVAALDRVALLPGDRVVVLASIEEVLTLHHDPAFEQADGQFAEAIVSTSRFKTPSIGELQLSRHGVRVLGVSRHRAVAGPELAAVRLRAADRLLLQGPPQGLAAAAEASDLVELTEPRTRSFRRRKAPVAVLAMAAVVVGAALGAPIAALALVAVVVVLVFGCVDGEEAWQSVDGGLLVLIYGMLAVGRGLEDSGAVELVVGQIQPWIASAPPVLSIVAIYALASLLTEVVSNNAVAVILTPVAIGLAVALGIEPRAAVLAVMMGASASFATPIGYQTNTLVYVAGKYRFADFLRIGIPMNLIVGAALCAAIWLFWL